MSLRDVAGAADHCRIPCVLKVPGFGALADNMGAVVAGYATRQSLGFAVDFRL